MKIAIVSKYAPADTGGLESVVNGIISVIRRSGFNFDITVFYQRKRRGDKFTSEEYKSKEVMVPDIPVVSEVIYNFICGIKCASGNYDIVHTHGVTGAGYALIRRFIRDKAKFIHTFHGISYKSLECYVKRFGFPGNVLVQIYRTIMSYLEKLAGRKCDVAVAVSEGVKRDLVKYYGIPESKITVIHNAVDTEVFYPMSKDKAKELLKLDKSKKYILFVGKEAFRKGMDIAINAMRYLKFDNIVLLIVGPAKIDFKEDNIISLGELSRKKMVFVYNTAEVLILPSRYEGHPITALEALSCGLPLIVSRESNVEIINKNQGIVINENKPELFATEIKKLLKSEELKEMSNSCRKLAEKYSVNNQYKKYLELYLSFYESRNY